VCADSGDLTSQGVQGVSIGSLIFRGACGAVRHVAGVHLSTGQDAPQGGERNGESARQGPCNFRYRSSLTRHISTALTGVGAPGTSRPYGALHHKCSHGFWWDSPKWDPTPDSTAVPGL